jgi:hypothetical protein
MIVYLGLIVCVCAGWAVAWNESTKRKLNDRNAATELASFKKVGGWYEARVAELENETRQLAEQVIAAGGIKHAVAMPRFDDPDAGAVWRTDDTGLVRERVDPNELDHLGL